MYCSMLIPHVLNKAGNSSVNSMSYSIKNIHNITKFIFICMFMSDRDLKPHSQKCLLLLWFLIL